MVVRRNLAAGPTGAQVAGVKCANTRSEAKPVRSRLPDIAEDAATRSALRHRATGPTGKIRQTDVRLAKLQSRCQGCVMG
jgi:hypothetical protein